MAIEFSCPYCQQLVRTPLAAAGKKGKCPQCQAVVQIPAVQSPQAERATAQQEKPATPASRSAVPTTVEFFCVECGQLVRTPVAAAGKKGKCPHCQSLIDIPHRAVGSKSSGSAVVPRHTPARRTPTADLTPLEDLEPLDSLSPPHNSPPSYRSDGLTELTPLLDEVLPPLAPLPGGPLPSLPSSVWSARSASASSSYPARRVISDLGRQGLPWERDPSLETFFETVRYVLGAPGDAFLRMHRQGIGSPIGFFLISAVAGNLLAITMWTVLRIAVIVIYAIVFANAGESLVIPWYREILSFGLGACLVIFMALFSGTIGGLFSAVLYHVCLLVCGGANAGFATTYRVVGFGLGSVYMLASIPIVGPLFAFVMQPIVLAYGFMNAHETSGGRAFLAAILPTLFGLFLLGIILLANAPAIIEAVKKVLEQMPHS
jgi:DNA-directed RNA polymerase subunit M/transcription elongation factor TFIIS